MHENPYQSPQTSPKATALADESNRTLARRNVRLVLVILSLPAIYNFVCFNFPSNSNIPLPIHNFYRCLNFFGLIITLSIVWFYGLNCFDLITRTCHVLFSRKPTLQGWRAALYETISRSVPFGIAGAILWAIWIFAFYQTNIGFYTVSYPVGILAHILAAALYIPLVFRWYNLERKHRPKKTT